MSSCIEEFKSQAQLEDRLATICQLLKIRYKNEAPSEVIEQLALMPSNKMLRLLLTQSLEELLTNLEKNSIGVEESTLKYDLFKVIGPLEQYYIQKKGEQEALEALAKLRFGSIDSVIESAIAYLLQTPAHNSVRVLYTSTREELAALIEL